MDIFVNVLAASAALREGCSQYSNVSLSQASLPMPFGTHHTKMMILKYGEFIVRKIFNAQNSSIK